jgi:DNA modification methylase
MAARKLNLQDVPTITLDNLTDIQKRAYIIADNKLALNAGWDNELLMLELNALSDADYDLDLTGFSADEISDLTPEKITDGLTDEDAVPDLPEVPQTVLGDVWLLGNHRLMCGDSTSIDAVEKLMDGQKADMVFTDPPYGMSLDTDYSKMPSTKESGNKNYNKVIGDNNDFTPELIHTVFACFDYCKEIFMWGADYYAEYLPHKNNGSWIVWDKRCDEKFDKMIGSGFELCWSKAKHKRMLARINNTLFSGEADARNKVHPTQKPIKLVLWFFDYFSLKDKKNVVDLYGGSGSTLIASEKVGKNSFLMELDPNYCDVIVKRWQEFTGKKAIHADTGLEFNK